MKAIKIIAALVAVIWLVSMVVLSVGGPMLVEHSDEAAEALVEASGIKDSVAMAQDERCRLAKVNYDNLWERYVDNQMPERMDDALERADASVKAFCPQE